MTTIQQTTSSPSMEFLSKAGDFFTGIADKIQSVWQACLPALEGFAEVTGDFFTTHKKETVYVVLALGIAGALVGIYFAANWIYTCCNNNNGNAITINENIINTEIHSEEKSEM